jgi:sec-independent protein translocase protein TatC
MAEPHLRSTPDDDEDDGLKAGRMGFLEHLDELRTRLIRSCLAIAAGMIVAFLFSDRIADFVEGPVIKVLPPGTALVFVRPGEAFSFYLDLSLIGGVVLAVPFIMYQVWGFIAPALYAREKKLVVPFVLLTALGTVAGALFSHYVLFPGMIAFFGTFNSPKMKFLPRVEDTFELYKTLLIGMILVFQIPTLVFFLAKMRAVTARFLWRHFKYAIFITAVAAAVLTPTTDPWNQIVVAAPMIGLYLVGIGIAWMVEPRRAASTPSDSDSPKLRLVIGAMVIDQAVRGASRR